MKFEHISVTEEQYWKIKQIMADKNIKKFHKVIDLLLKGYKK